MNTADAKRVLETALICAQQPLPLRDMKALFDEQLGADTLRGLLDELVHDWQGRGVELVTLSSGWRFQGRPEMRTYLDRLHPEKPPRYSRAAMETLAIVAYLQPVARPEISRIRGVAADSATATLLERGLIEEVGRSEFGAILYRTTALFLRLFGLDSLAALPDFSTWDPDPEEEDELRERLLRAGGARSGNAAAGGPAVELPQPRELGEDPGHVDMPGDAFLSPAVSGPGAEDAAHEDRGPAASSGDSADAEPA